VSPPVVRATGRTPQPVTWRSQLARGTRLRTADHLPFVAMKNQQGEVVVEIHIDDLAGQSSNIDGLRPEAESARLG
jgi:hypothetical protein